MCVFELEMKQSQIKRTYIVIAFEWERECVLEWSFHSDDDGERGMEWWHCEGYVYGSKYRS